MQAGIDVIASPSPGGDYFAVTGGINSSSNAVQSGLDYTTLTNFIAKSVLKAMGRFIGLPPTVTNVRRANAALNTFFAGLASADMIGSLDGSQPWKVVCDAWNNKIQTSGLGFLIADTQVHYNGIISKFLINLEGGASVTITN